VKGIKGKITEKETEENYNVIENTTLMAIVVILIIIISLIIILV
jgi:hypothetical protein